MRRKWIVTIASAVVFVGAGGAGFVYERIHQAPLLGKLDTVASLKYQKTYSVGDFRIQWNGTKGEFQIVNQYAPNHVVFATPARHGFIGAAAGQMTSSEKIGYFTLHRSLQDKYVTQTVDKLSLVNGSLIFQGDLIDRHGNKAAYTFSLSALQPNQLQYNIAVHGSAVNRVYLNFASSPGEHFYGFGVQYSDLDMQGKKLPILVQEHGDGRGMQPLTFLANLTHGAGGHWYNTYAPVPHFISSSMQSLYSESPDYQVFNFTDPNTAQLEVDASTAKGILFSGTTPSSLVQSYTDVVGRMQPLPNWTQQGLIFGAEGGTSVVQKNLDKLLNAGVPVTGLWIQDWVGQRKTSFGDQLWWNWQLNHTQYPNWTQFTSNLNQHGIRLLGYINPFLTDAKALPGATNLYQIAKERGYFVKSADGQPVVFQYPNFTASLIDLTNPQARTWLEGIMKQQLVDNGFSGWMADFGEELPLNVTLSNGNMGAALHNEYPVLWAQVNKTVMQQSGLGSDGLFFMRSGFSTSPAVTSDFWLGDQLESWDVNNGIKSSVIALLSSGLSGYSLESSDIGGYTSISQFPLHYVRSQDLLMRWIELNAFTTLFRSHEGNQPSKNVQIYSNPEVIKQVRKFSILFKDLLPYREQLMKEASLTGEPVDRPLFFNYPNDPNTYAITYQEFMLGPDVLVAPVMNPGVTKVRVYLPKGDWVHVWNGKTYTVQTGEYVDVSAPIGQPAVFYLAGTSVEGQFAQALKDIRSGA